MLWNNWHLLSSILTIVITYWLDYRNQRLLLFSMFRTLLHVWYWIYVLVIASLRQLHWLPIESRIQFKLCLMMHLIHTGHCPSYISDTGQLVADHASRIQVFVLLQLHGIFYHDCALFAHLSLVLWPQGLDFAFRSISFDWINRFCKNQLKIYLFNHSV